VGPQYDALLDAIGDARIVTLGAQTHGTHQFYSHRAEITRTLIEKKGFNCVSVEADWPDAYHINLYVKGHGEPTEIGARAVLVNFKRSPLWVWRNEVMKNFVHWLRLHNDSQKEILPKRDRMPVGFYGLDVYSFHESMHEVTSKLKKMHHDQGAHMIERKYSLLEGHRGLGDSLLDEPSIMDEGHLNEAAAALKLLQMEKYKLTHRFGLKMDEEEFWDIEQNAKLVKDAEKIYRLMYTDPVAAWNLRDRHMAVTLKELAEHLNTRRRQSKIVVWQHNDHAGDGRYTEWHQKGEENLGTLIRQDFGIENTFNIGFTTYQGKLLATDGLSDQPKIMKLHPARENSYADLFHKVGQPAFYLILRSNDRMHPVPKELAYELKGPKLERSIGTMYTRRKEGDEYYVQADISKQFDCVIHLDHTIPIQPLEEIADAPYKGVTKPELMHFTM